MPDTPKSHPYICCALTGSTENINQALLAKSRTNISHALTFSYPHKLNIVLFQSIFFDLSSCILMLQKKITYFFLRPWRHLVLYAPPLSFMMMMILWTPLPTYSKGLLPLRRPLFLQDNDRGWVFSLPSSGKDLLHYLPSSKLIPHLLRPTIGKLLLFLLEVLLCLLFLLLLLPNSLVVPIPPVCNLI